jgi:cation diffusion facilitator CzcD-associated flavoprotein CzcO
MSNGKRTDCEAVVLGAGPYGLSAASHLKAAGVDVRVFGKPMDFWADKMPAGMLLRSPRVASNISDPSRRTTLDAYESSAAIPPRAPVALETFVEYGRWFQRQLLPGLDQREIVAVNRNAHGFAVALEDGAVLHSDKVVIGAGIGPFLRIPSEFAALPSSQLSHCYQGCDPKGFLKRRVAVVGAGQSALECAALLHEAGAEVEVIARLSELRWIGQHPWLHRLGPISSLLYSSHDVGPAGISRMVAAPKLMTQVPLQLRDKIRKRAVRPAGSQWLKARLKNVSITTGRSVAAAKSAGTEVELKLDDGSRRVVDHVLLGTGYSVDVARYKFLPPELIRGLDLEDGYPVLKSGFASSIPGLHFIGATAARTFGPLLYFVAGTEFTSKELTAHFRRERSRDR